MTHEGPILLGDVHCGGNETSILQCRYSERGLERYCSHEDDAAVECDPTPAQQHTGQQFPCIICVSCKGKGKR